MRGQYSGVPVPSLWRSLCHLSILKSEYWQCTEITGGVSRPLLREAGGVNRPLLREASDHTSDTLFQSTLADWKNGDSSSSWWKVNTSCGPARQIFIYQWGADWLERSYDLPRRPPWTASIHFRDSYPIDFSHLSFNFLSAQFYHAYGVLLSLCLCSLERKR
jgi:hypothetical protein